MANGNMEPAYDKLGLKRPGSEPLPDFGMWTDQPYLDQMTRKAIEILSGPRGDQPFALQVEGALIDKIAALADAQVDGIVINGAAFTHTSVALRDALLGAHLPTVEVHISNIYKREDFRHKSLTAPACAAVISGLGLEGYHAAVRYLLLPGAKA